MRVVATAGHVDHGKSSLVLALTGTDPDRWAEEKRRGLTIDLGFAHTTLPNGEAISIVDVPGHVRFLRNMLAGVGAVDACVFVVAATEGWKPQSEEHLRILDLLGLRTGVVALTKTDLVDDDWRELQTLDVRDHLAGTFLADAPVVPVSVVTGSGLELLRTELGSLVERTAGAADHGRPRLWVDRSFAAKGAGTVVTGTLTGGSLHIDDEVLVEPGARRARVRSIESHHERLDVIGPGSRVALNLSGIDHTQAQRGDVVVLPGQWPATTTADVEVLPIEGARTPTRGRLAAHIGSGDHPVDWRVLDAEGRFARLRLDTALPIAPGDRVVVRSTGRRATVCGARVLDVQPARRAADAPARLALPLEERVLDARPWLTEARATSSTTLSGATTRCARWTTGGRDRWMAGATRSQWCSVSGDGSAPEPGCVSSALRWWVGCGRRCRSPCAAGSHGRTRRCSTRISSPWRSAGPSSLLRCWSVSVSQCRTPCPMSSPGSRLDSVVVLPRSCRASRPGSRPTGVVGRCSTPSSVAPDHRSWSRPVWPTGGRPR